MKKRDVRDWKKGADSHRQRHVQKIGRLEEEREIILTVRNLFQNSGGSARAVNSCRRRLGGQRQPDGRCTTDVSPLLPPSKPSPLPDPDSWSLRSSPLRSVGPMTGVNPGIEGGGGIVVVGPVAAAAAAAAAAIICW